MYDLQKKKSPFQVHLNRKCFPDAVHFCRSESTALQLKQMPLGGTGAGVSLITQSHPIDIWFPDALKWYLVMGYFVQSCLCSDLLFTAFRTYIGFLLQKIKKLDLKWAHIAFKEVLGSILWYLHQAATSEVYFCGYKWLYSWGGQLSSAYLQALISSVWLALFIFSTRHPVTFQAFTCICPLRCP